MKKAEYPATPIPSYELPTCLCLRCEWSWHPTKNMKPRVCPSCHSPYWDTPRREKKAAK